MRNRLAAIFLIGAWLFSGVALADSKEEANRHFQIGKGLMKLEDFAGAVAELEQSVAIFPTKSGLFNLANCYKALHRYGDALDAYQRLRSEFGNKMDADMAALAKADEAQIRELVGEVQVSVSEDGAAIWVDGSQAGQSPMSESLYLGPGEHVIKASLNGYQDAEQRARVVSGSKFLVTLVLEPIGDASGVAPASDVTASPEAAGSPGPVPAAGAVGTSQGEKPARLTPLAWTGVGLTAVTGVVSVVSLVSAMLCYKDYQDRGEYYSSGLINTNDKELNDAKKKTKLYAGLSIGFGLVTGVFAATTVALFVLDASRKEKTDSGVALAPGAITFRY